MSEEKTFKPDNGAVWVREDKNGDKYLLLTVKLNDEETRLVGWKNKNKKENKHPSFRLYLDENQQKSTSKTRTTSKPKQDKPAPVAEPVEAQDDGNIEL